MREENTKDLCSFEHNGKNYVALVRKLTERECFRLMGVDDADIDKLLNSAYNERMQTACEHTDGSQEHISQVVQKVNKRIKKQNGIARTDLYKLAGNSIVVDVLYHIFRKAFVETGNESKQMSFFDLDESNAPQYDHEHPQRVVTLCSGYDSQCLALERLKRDFPPFDYELIAWSEFDPMSKKPLERQPAVIAHNALFPQWADRNLGDMTKIDWTKVPEFDLLTYSTPCQSISKAGLQHGFVEGSGTRSSIIWNVRDALEIGKPKYALLENVAAMVSEKFLPMFNLWRNEVHNLGYENYAQFLNAKHYGVPQNRDRIFLFSIRNDIEMYYNFPQRMPLKCTLQDILEDETDEKYYLNPVKVNKFVNDNLSMVTKYMDESDEKIEPLPEHLRKMIDNAREDD